MRGTRRWGALLAAALSAAIMGALVGPRSASAAAPIDLGLTDFGRILVDPATSHVFVSSPADSTIVVLSLSGQIVKTIAGEAGADGMVVVGSTLYVALRNAGAIDRIDTGTLTETSPLVGSLVAPYDLAYAGGKLWTTTGACYTFAVKLASVDPSAAHPTVTIYANAFNSTNGLNNCAAFVVNHDANLGLLIAYGATLTSFDVSGVMPVQQVSSYSNVRDAAVEPDGTHLMVADGNYRFQEFAISTLQSDGNVYPANNPTAAVDTTNTFGGRFVGAAVFSDQDTIFAYDIGDTANVVQQLDLPGWYGPGRDLAIGPDGSEAYFVSRSPDGTQHYFINVVPIPPAGSPGPPTGVTAVAGVGSATVSWTAPTNTGTSPITAYRIFSSSGAEATVAGTARSGTIAGLTPAPHTFTVTAINSAGMGRPSQATGVIPLDGGTYHPLTPARILDTRNGTGGVPASPMNAGQTIELRVTGSGGVPTQGVSAVLLNVTAINPASWGWLTVYPTGSAAPNASNLNFAAGQTKANLVEVPVGSFGAVSLLDARTRLDLIADVEGWVGDATNSYSRAGLYNPISPGRVLDTRSGVGAPRARLGPGGSVTLQVSGTGLLVNTDVSAAVFNFTVTNATQDSWLTVYPTGGQAPNASNLTFRAGETVANRAVVGLGAGGQVTIQNARGYVDVIADLGGWFTDSTSGAGGSAYVPVFPTRIGDTRSCNCALGPGWSLVFTLSSSAPPTTALELNVTATGATATSWLTAWPYSSGTTHPPEISDVNFGPHQTVPNLVIVMIGQYSEFYITNANGWTNIIVDIEGYFGQLAPAPPKTSTPTRRFDWGPSKRVAFGGVSTATSPP